ncbi:hypothetical protein BJX66DRAFT_338944 [Aspergillus keveii]|uniref:F-box domain-containing protein n=1 Tax=Aspergillus keveii TaxID=714993 RepID=A0ABR4G2U3_9EURO
MSSYLMPFLRRIFRRSAAPRTSPLVNLPTECVLMIIEQLPPLDQACLILTCKSMHYTFKSILENELLRFPRLYQLLMPEMRLSFGDTRRQLLHRLEGDSDSIAYCAKCLKLHRQDHFDLNWSYFSGPPGYNPYCNRRAGIVDLCPCVSMTLLDRRAVGKYLVQTAKNKVAYLNGPLGASFQQVTTDCGLPGLFHRCELRTDNGNQVFARFEATLYINDNNELMAFTLCRPLEDPGTPYWEFSGLPITMYNIVFAAINSDINRVISPWFFEDDEGNEQGHVDRTVDMPDLKAKRSLGYYDEHFDNRLWARQTRANCNAFDGVRRSVLRFLQQ